jgi:deoxyribodipyrimidine photo-lyase
LEDNIGLFHALESKYPVIPLFIFDDLRWFARNDARVGFIHESLSTINELKQIGSSLLVKRRNYYRRKSLIQDLTLRSSLIRL